MKKAFICTMMLVLSTISFGQQANPTQTFTKQDYLEKSKRQKTTAWVLVGGGVILEISGAIAYQHGNAGILLMGAGFLSQAISVPFFIFAGINKKKSKMASLSFKLENIPDIRPTAISFRSNPEILLKLNL